MARWMWVLTWLTGCSVPTAVGNIPADLQAGASGSASGESSDSGELSPITSSTTEGEVEDASSTGVPGRPAPTMTAFAIRRGDVPKPDGDRRGLGGDIGHRRRPRR